MSFIRIDSKAFEHNIKEIKKLSPAEKIAVVLKDNAYGHGLTEMAQLAVKNGIRHAVVRNVREAAQIASLFESVLVLAETPESSVEQNIHITINRTEDIKKLAGGTSVHLKVDTGMHRNGVPSELLESAIEMIKESGLLLKGIFTHSRSSDELSSELFWQYKSFCEIKKRAEKRCKELGIKMPKFHFANSSALLRMKEDALFDMVRIGIAAYGYSECNPVFDPPKLKPVLSLWGEKMASREVLKNQRIGYSGAAKSDRDCVVSTYDLGYSDGVFRDDGKKEFFLGDGTKVMGKISMDNLVLESEKEEVCIIDDAALWAKRFNTITYEIVVKLSPFIKRVVV